MKKFEQSDEQSQAAIITTAAKTTTETTTKIEVKKVLIPSFVASTNADRKLSEFNQKR